MYLVRPGVDNEKSPLLPQVANGINRYMQGDYTSNRVENPDGMRKCPNTRQIPAYQRLIGANQEDYSPLIFRCMKMNLKDAVCTKCKNPISPNDWIEITGTVDSNGNAKVKHKHSVQCPPPNPLRKLDL